MPVRIPALNTTPKFSSLPARALVVAVATCFFATSCVLAGSRPSKVANGEKYEPGQPTYDEFFSSLYAVQLTMGQAPDRAQKARESIAKTVDVPPTASADELSAALDKRLDLLAKSGVSVKVSTSGLDGTDPTAKVVKSGTPAGGDAETVTALESAVHDAAALLLELRHAKPELSRLTDALPPLDPKVDTAFSDESSRQRAEVHKNLSDAGKLLPLMVSREADVDGKLVELFHALEKASPPAIATPPPAPEVTDKKKSKKGAPAKATGPAAEKSAKPKPVEAAEPRPAKPAPEAAEPRPKPADEPKPPKPKPSQDFEP
jgi:hypothetical protein